LVGKHPFRDEGHAAFEEYERTGDETAIRTLFDWLLAPRGSAESEPPVNLKGYLKNA